jgi:hypothetical protein
MEDRDRGAGEAGEIGRAAKLRQARVVLEERLQRHRGGQRVLLNAPRRRLEDAAMHRVVEVMRLQQAADAVEDLVVDEDCAQEGLLGLDIAGQGVRLRLRPRGSVRHSLSLLIPDSLHQNQVSTACEGRG